MIHARRIALLAALTIAAACGGSSSQYPAPASPEAVVRAFLDAAKDSNLAQMGNLWGSSRGPASGYMDRTTLVQRLTVIRVYLAHDSYDIVPSNLMSLGDNADQRTVRVRLVHHGCTPTVPFTTVRYGSGWLVSNIDLSTIGNPALPCAPSDST